MNKQPSNIDLDEEDIDSGINDEQGPQSKIELNAFQQISKIPLELIKVDDHFNCRGHITPFDVEDLIQDFRRVGQLQPILVRQIPLSCRTGKEEYLVVAGNRRTVAARFLRWATINAVIRNDLTDVDIHVVNLSENVKRRVLTLMQEAKGISNLLDLGMKRKQIAERLSASEGWVQVRTMVNILCRDESIRAEFEKENIRTSDVRGLFTLFKKEQTDKLNQAIKGIKERKEREEQREKNRDVVVHISRKEQRANERRRRSEAEVQRAIDIVLGVFGESLATRCLSWANGYTSSVELITLIKKLASERKIPFTPPEDNLI